MPSTTKDIKDFFTRIAKLEAKVENLMDYQKWQMGLLAAILLLVLRAWTR